MSAVSLDLLFRLIEVALARTLRLSLSRMLIPPQIDARRQIAGELIAALVARGLPQRMPGLRLELLRNVVLGAATAATVRIAPLIQLLPELVAAVLPEVAHEVLLYAGQAADGVPRALRTAVNSSLINHPLTGG